MNEIASRYGNALYSLAVEKNLVSDYQSEIKILIKLLEDNHEFIDILSSGFVSISKKEEIVDSTFVGINDEIKSLIKIVIANGRSDMLLDVFYSFNSEANNYLNVDEGYVYSITKLDESTLNQLDEKVSKLEGRKVELRNLIDPSLIGGLKVVVHDHVYDGSVKHHLAELRNSLLKKESDD